ncbi:MULTISPECIES: Mov34/MPN/PAD-1 family protein [Azospirillaceae]|uniref:Mov34/MPN/PAD-1 family protein n=1 Tax=Azospirillaceae TaxID=2829815 RepID=UPI000B7625A5|nr:MULTISPECIES: Mov34/MPN/PAD-1 family protein [Azospirillaceae]MDG5496978.1 Mov34/MPN/PAD-1 family protein [Niveispirillum sp. BGYR6]SNS83941.1 Proteasome lid subunit RPN8/RPN11, contains Jab1/MPN metalloenzyme (JAMM) motif [Azospirillum sp. RU38E]SNT01191.1 Proteasome lid subunit RPN8/RPN11, contains Jab1/MPN metalloenzyme (JAMM) motif [Azospirillum sp. RU37A]
MFDPCTLARAEIDRFNAHVLACYPQEACGIITGGSFVPVPNIHPEPEDQFAMAPADQLRHGPVEAVVHSHIAGRHHPVPSAQDMRQQMASAVPWGLVSTDGEQVSSLLWWGDFRLDEPLIGAEFIHGVQDCYSAIRKWYWQERRIRLPDFPRDHEWWADGGNLYETGFPQAGFVEVPLQDLAHGDVVLGQVRAPCLNHGGIYLEGGLIFHHLQERLSRRESIYPWMRYVKKALRYAG